MKNVLFIVYYFPPMGASGVQRPLKFIKYLREYGWNPIIITPHPGMYHTFDHSLIEEVESLGIEVHRIDAKTPFHVIGKQAKEVNKIPDWLAETARRILSLLYIPDNKKAWIKPAVEKAKKLINEKKIEAIYSTSPPPSNHIIAARLKDTFGIPVVMDFRDDWLEYQSIIYPTPIHKKINARYEKKTVEKADVVVTNNNVTLESLRSRTDNGKVEYQVISHGYDPEDFSDIDTGYKPGNTLKILYSGIFYQERQPDILLKAIKNIIELGILTKDKIELHFQGGLEQRHLSMIEKCGLSECLHNHGYVEHKKAVENLCKADILWFIVDHRNQSKSVTPGKLYEYMATRKPILGLITEGDSTEVLKEYKAGYYCNPRDVKAVEENLKEIINHWKNNTLPTPDEEFIKKHNRKELTAELADIFNKISEPSH